LHHNRESDSSDDYVYITLQEAYENYISGNDSSSNVNCIDNDGILCQVKESAESTVALASISDDDTSTLSDVQRKVSCICGNTINNDQEIINCISCKREMHSANQCIYGITQYYDDRNQQSYCSLSCCKRWPVFEVEIVGERGKNYRIKLNTGEIIIKSKAKVNKLAEYYKIVSIYNDKKLQLSNDNSSDVQILDNIPPPAINSTSSISKIPPILSSRRVC
jgi:hypothetical protein